MISRDKSQIGPYSGGWHSQPVNGAMLMFNHISGTNVLWRGRGTTSCRRRAPRVLQVALTNRCTRRCAYCYQERSDACLDYEFLLGLLVDASRWGVLEVAFGGGEPLLFPRLMKFLRELRAHTRLGLNLTTNGDLLSPELAADLAQLCGQVRVSVHDGARWRRAFRLLSGVETGANILVTPANLGDIELLVREAISLGAADVLLLGYKGPSAGLHLGEGELQRLERSILRMQHLPLRLDACWYPLLPNVPQLLERHTCGAADEILAITPDRKVKACSFHLDGVPVSSIDDLKAAFDNLRSSNTGDVLDGCMRSRFAAAVSGSSGDQDQMWVWHARASNNSGDCTIVGRFQEVARAQDAAKAFRELSRAHEAFLASPEGRKWYEQNDYRPQPTPPLQLFAQIHGFDWSDPEDALSWEEDGAGAPVLTAGAVGHSVVIYHPYCCGFSEKPFREYFSRCGARQFGHFWYDRPAVIVHAEGTNTAAVDEIQQHLRLVQMAKYPSEVADPPPWGKQCTDDRLASDEDRSALVASAEVLLHAGGNKLTLGLKLENTYAGAVAVEHWLRSKGFTNLGIEIDDVLSSLAQTGQPPVTPRTGVFPRAIPLNEQVRDARPEELVDLAYRYYDVPDGVEKGLAALPPQRLLYLVRDMFCRRKESGQEIGTLPLWVCQRLGADTRGWMRELWQYYLAQARFPAMQAIEALAAALPNAEAAALASAWVVSTTDRRERASRIHLLGPLQNSDLLPLIDDWWANSQPGDAVTGEWGLLASRLEVPWKTLATWLKKGRPMSLIALDAITCYIRGGLPARFVRPSRDNFEAVLADCEKTDRSPRARQVIANARQHAAVFLEIKA